MARVLDRAFSMAVLNISPFVASGMTWFFALCRAGDTIIELIGLFSNCAACFITGKVKTSLCLISSTCFDPAAGLVTLSFGATVGLKSSAAVVD